jgi:hypothetical protein
MRLLSLSALALICQLSVAGAIAPQQNPVLVRVNPTTQEQVQFDVSKANGVDVKALTNAFKAQDPSNDQRDTLSNAIDSIEGSVAPAASSPKPAKSDSRYFTQYTPGYPYPVYPIYPVYPVYPVYPYYGYYYPYYYGGYYYYWYY